MTTNSTNTTTSKPVRPWPSRTRMVYAVAFFAVMWLWTGPDGFSWRHVIGMTVATLCGVYVLFYDPWRDRRTERRSNEE